MSGQVDRLDVVARDSYELMICRRCGCEDFREGFTVCCDCGLMQEPDQTVIEVVPASRLRGAVEDRDELRKAARALRRACQDAGGPVVPTAVAQAIARVTELGGQ